MIAAYALLSLRYMVKFDAHEEPSRSGTYGDNSNELSLDNFEKFYNGKYKDVAQDFANNGIENSESDEQETETEDNSNIQINKIVENQEKPVTNKSKKRKQLYLIRIGENDTRTILQAPRTKLLILLPKIKYVTELIKNKKRGSFCQDKYIDTLDGFKFKNPNYMDIKLPRKVYAYGNNKIQIRKIINNITIMVPKSMQNLKMNLYKLLDIVKIKL